MSLSNFVTRYRNSLSAPLKYANSNRNQGRFNDVTITTTDTSIPANRMVLSCYSPYFDDIFASEENDQVNESVVEIPDVDGKSLELVIQFIYTGQISINSDNIFGILSAANYLELNEAKQFCFEFLEKRITTNNCIDILITAKQYDNLDLRDKVYKYISDNYEAIIQTPAFLDLDQSELFFIVYHLKTKFYVNDSVLCRSLLSWTKQDEETRKRHLQERLVKFVNIAILSSKLMQDLLNESLICENPALLFSLNESYKKLKAEANKVLIAGGCYNQKVVKVVYSLVEEESIKVYTDLPIPLDFHCLIKNDNFLYVVGGATKTEKVIINKVFRLSLNETDSKWEEMNAMKNERSTFGAAVFNDVLVVCGGRGGENLTSSTESEMYDFEQNQWKQAFSLKQKRFGNQSAAAGGNLYTIGGCDSGETFSSVERLSGLNQTWKFVSPMQTPRRWFAAVSCDDVIYAIGGLNNEGEATKSVEKYDCAADEWSYVSDMNIERNGHSACVMQGRIYVVGGWNPEKEPLEEIDCYDPSTNRWEIVARIDDKLLGHAIVAF